MPFFVHAQSTPEEAAQINTDDIALISDPEIPGAYQDVNLSLNSYLTDLNRAVITWKVNGKIALAGYGKIKFTFTTGGIGEKMTVSVNMIVTSGESITKTIVVNPSEINLVWEGADSYTPPFYRGRALPTSEGAIRVLAIPQIGSTSGITDTNNYVFRWKKDDTLLSNDSGYGKSALVYQQDYLNTTETIEVAGQNNATGEVATGTITVGLYQPKVLMYTRDPILGVDWDHEVGNFINVSTNDTTLIAIPYFFSPFNPLANDLRYIWNINGDTVDTPSIKNVLTIKSGSSKGISNLKLTIENTLKLFLDGEKQLSINLK